MGEYIPPDMVDAAVHIAREAATPFNLMVPPSTSSGDKAKTSRSYAGPGLRATSSSSTASASGGRPAKVPQPLAFPGPGLKASTNPPQTPRLSSRNFKSNKVTLEYPAYCAAYLHENFEAEWADGLKNKPEHQSYIPEDGWGQLLPLTSSTTQRTPDGPPVFGFSNPFDKGTPRAVERTPVGPPVLGFEQVSTTNKTTPDGPPLSGLYKELGAKPKTPLGNTTTKKFHNSEMLGEPAQPFSHIIQGNVPLKTNQVPTGHHQPNSISRFPQKKSYGLTYQQRWVRLWPARDVHTLRDVPSIYFSKCPSLRNVTSTQFVDLQARTFCWGHERGLSDVKRNIKLCRYVLGNPRKSRCFTPLVLSRPKQGLGRGITMGGPSVERTTDKMFEQDAARITSPTDSSSSAEYCDALDHLMI